MSNWTRRVVQLDDTEGVRPGARSQELAGSRRSFEARRRAPRLARVLLSDLGASPLAPEDAMTPALALRATDSSQSQKVRLTYRRPATLSAEERDAIWSLLDRSVQRDRPSFERKLSHTGEVWLAHLPGGELVGFGAVDMIEVEHEGRTYALFYTHWGVLAPQLRGRNVSQRVGLRCFLRYRMRHPLRPVYWLFTASTFHSYLLLARNAATYWPRPGTPCPPRERAILAAAMQKLGDPTWDPDAGVLRRNGASRYREGVVDDDPTILDHPVVGAAVRFYREQNPRQVEGDSLVCLCPFSVGNWLWCARAVLGRMGVSRVRPPGPETRPQHATLQRTHAGFTMLGACPGTAVTGQLDGM
jgi:hypothetical protein